MRYKIIRVARPEALENIKDAVDLYIEDCRAAGVPVPTETKKAVPRY